MTPDSSLLPHHLPPLLFETEEWWSPGNPNDPHRTIQRAIWPLLLWFPIKKRLFIPLKMKRKGRGGNSGCTKATFMIKLMTSCRIIYDPPTIRQLILYSILTVAGVWKEIITSVIRYQYLLLTYGCVEQSVIKDCLNWALLSLCSQKEAFFHVSDNNLSFVFLHLHLLPKKLDSAFHEASVAVCCGPTSSLFGRFLIRTRHRDSVCRDNKPKTTSSENTD